MLGLPFSEAIDMWSLGVVMGYIALGESLFPGFFDYDTVSLSLLLSFLHSSYKIYFYIILYCMKQNIWVLAASLTVVKSFAPRSALH